MHGHAILLVHLELVSDPVSVGERKQVFGQFIVSVVHGLVIHDLRLLDSISVQYALPLLSR